MSKPFWEERLIYYVISGSRAYGTNVPGSDTDYRGICIPPEEVLLGLTQWDQKKPKVDGKGRILPDEKDEIIVSLKKFITLALTCNPNVIDFLYAPDDCVLHVNPLGRGLLHIRDEFLSKRAFLTYGRMALEELKRMKKYDPNGDPDGKRFKIIEQYGYDTKQAMVGIRSLRMGKEILTKGMVIVRRSDAQELIDIRNGKYTENQIVDMATALNEELKAARDLSTLPEEPNYQKIEKWLIDTHMKALDWDWRR